MDAWLLAEDNSSGKDTHQENHSATSAVRECVDDSSSSSSGLEVKCSDSVRLVSGPSLCSGSVQIWNQSWTWVCEGALDQQGAEVLCRELGCGAPSLLQGALSPLGQRFHCEGNESALMDCPRSGSETCSSGAAVNLTCSELRLVGGASRCAGTVEVRHRGEWGWVGPDGRWFLEDTAAVCRDLDCGSAVYGEKRDDFPKSPVWEVISDCVKKKKSAVQPEGTQRNSCRNLSYTSLSYTSLSYTSLSLSYTSLSYTSLSYTSLSYTSLSFSYTSLSYTRVCPTSYMRLSYMRLSYTSLTYTSLSYTSLTYMSLSYMSLAYMSLTYMSLTYLVKQSKMDET
ncbi:scavenger receptor cysteine-rich type 1 protein M130-like [Periophthalmus magnuspinnatus]|uniref:scavenger receptor cysteine-rich type 1 protein M130-like n=1 Tax=Periophthalmus magnuspinnatus TaxID=409849 RepID=UPI002436D8F7|nr:scavenger receptor cysteine-rich type 1 protein M130-like [Periophthalmus magnuspinnatus]